MLAIVLCAACDGRSGGPEDASAGMDGARRDGAAIDGPVTDQDAGCSRNVEICGDFMDQNCDGQETSCGDTDMDGVEACRPGEAPPACDCDDAHNNAYPPVGALPGGTEVCDDLDNDCNGRFDEAAACCPACMALDNAMRGDVCTAEGACDCSSVDGIAPCPSGQTCCSSGCVDVMSDEANCGSCNSACERCGGSDTCNAGTCGCGSGGGCPYTDECVGGSCQPETPECA